jgi:DNA polymerase-1
MDEVDAFMSWLERPRRLLGVDTETTGLSLARDHIRLIQFGDSDEGWALPMEWAGLARHVLERYDGPMVLQNAKFDAGMLRAAGYPFPWERVHDTRVMLHLHDSLGPQSLKPAAARYLGPWAAFGQQELKKAMAKNKWTWATVPVNFPAYWAYGCLDTVVPVRLAEYLWPKVQYAREAYDLEMACQRVLTEVELRGVRLDVEYVEQAAEALRRSLAERLERLPVNPNSPRQIVEALEAQGATLSKRTQGGALSVDEEVLAALEQPLAKELLSYRHDKKVLTSYFESFMEHQTDGLLHPSINQLQARTGRMSVTNPAMQTLPRDAYVRDAIIPDNEDHVLVLADYDTQELRTTAHFARDTNMINAFLEAQDLHMATALMAFGEDRAAEMRTPSKNGMYSWVYGARPTKFARTIGITVEEGERIFLGLAEAYPGVARLMAQLIDLVKERAGDGEYGWVQLLDGRRLKVPKEKAYAALNYLIQGSCATVLKQAIVNLDAAGLGHALRLPVHDELVFSLHRDEVEDALPTIRDCMERHDLLVPLTVGIKVVDRWGDPYRKEAA